MILSLASLVRTLESQVKMLDGIKFPKEAG